MFVSWSPIFSTEASPHPNLDRYRTFQSVLQELNAKSERFSSSAKGGDWISPQTCDQCGLVLKSLSILQYHMKAIHSTYSDRDRDGLIFKNLSRSKIKIT